MNTEAERLDDEVQVLQAGSKRRTIKLAPLITEIIDKKTYLQYGYKDIYTYCYDRFKIKKTQVKVYSLVTRTYANKNNDGSYIIPTYLSEYGVEKLYLITHLPGFTSENFTTLAKEYNLNPKLSRKQVQTIVNQANGKAATEKNPINRALQESLEKASSNLNRLRILCSDSTISNEDFRAIAIRVLTTT